MPLRGERLDLNRWIDVAALGWYLGETHVHRGLEELPNATGTGQTQLAVVDDARAGDGG